MNQYFSVIQLKSLNNQNQEIINKLPTNICQSFLEKSVIKNENKIKMQNKAYQTLPPQNKQISDD